MKKIIKLVSIVVVLMQMTALEAAMFNPVRQQAARYGRTALQRGMRGYRPPQFSDDTARLAYENINNKVNNATRSKTADNIEQAMEAVKNAEIKAAADVAELNAQKLIADNNAALADNNAALAEYNSVLEGQIAQSNKNKAQEVADQIAKEMAVSAEEGALIKGLDWLEKSLKKSGNTLARTGETIGQYTGKGAIGALEMADQGLNNAQGKLRTMKQSLENVWRRPGAPEVEAAQLSLEDIGMATPDFAATGKEITNAVKQSASKLQMAATEGLDTAGARLKTMWHGGSPEVNEAAGFTLEEIGGAAPDFSIAGKNASDAVIRGLENLDQRLNGAKESLKNFSNRFRTPRVEDTTFSLEGIGPEMPKLSGVREAAMETLENAKIKLAELKNGAHEVFENISPRQARIRAIREESFLPVEELGADIIQMAKDNPLAAARVSGLIGAGLIASAIPNKSAEELNVQSEQAALNEKEIGKEYDEEYEASIKSRFDERVEKVQKERDLWEQRLQAYKTGSLDFSIEEIRDGFAKTDKDYIGAEAQYYLLMRDLRRNQMAKLQRGNYYTVEPDGIEKYIDLYSDNDQKRRDQLWNDAEQFQSHGYELMKTQDATAEDLSHPRYRGDQGDDGAVGGASRWVDINKNLPAQMALPDSRWLRDFSADKTEEYIKPTTWKNYFANKAIEARRAANYSKKTAGSWWNRLKESSWHPRNWFGKTAYAEPLEVNENIDMAT